MVTKRRKLISMNSYCKSVRHLFLMFHLVLTEKGDTEAQRA